MARFRHRIPAGLEVGTFHLNIVEGRKIAGLGMKY